MMSANFPLRLLVLALLLGAASGCGVHPVARPQVAFSDNWSHAQGADPVAADWWQGFGSPQLNQLVTAAHTRNPDLRITTERVQQAELLLRSANASWFPAFDVSASTGESRSRFDGEAWGTGESSRVSLGASYEVDLWGRLSAARAVATADFKASQYDAAAARLSISGAVASGWFAWLALLERSESAAENIRIARRIADIVEARYRYGAATAADVARQQTNLLSQEAALLPLQLQVRQTRAALALLVGEVPQGFALQRQSLLALAVPSIAAGVPADVLTRRPDLASAEAQLQAADADVAAARAALLPGVQLTASASRSAAALFSLRPPLDTAGWSLSLAQTLFDGGRLRYQVRLSESQRVALVEQYRKTILIALREVDDALDRNEVDAELERRQAAILAQAERTLHLTEVRYREGSDDLLSLLEAQRSLFQARDQLVQQRQARLDAAVDLYLALGGGWTPTASAAARG